MRNALLIVALLAAALAIGIALTLQRPEEPVDAPQQEAPPSAAVPLVQVAGRSAEPVVAPAPAPSPAVDDENRRATEIVELVRQGKVGHARALADQFYRAYPRSPRVVEIERLTGYHPRPYGPEL